MKRQSIETLGGIELTERALNPDGTYAGLMPMQSAGRALAELGRELVEDMSQPAARAGFGVSLLSGALCSRARMGFVPSVVISVMIGMSVEHLYGMAEDIHAKLTTDATSEV